MKTLRDRVAVVTGAAAGVGRAIALQLARAGSHVVLADVDVPGMESLALEVRALGRRCSIEPTDVRVASQIEQLLARTLAEHGACHVMVNNAGVLHAAPLLEADPGAWQRVLDINLGGVLHGSRVFGRHFASQREGHIVNMASAGGLFPSPGMTMYSTSKFAVIGFTQQLRWELAEQRVGVTLVIPGLIRTSLFSQPGTGLGHLELAPLMRISRDPVGLARKIQRGIERDRPVVRYGHEPLLFAALRLLPDWLMDPIAKRFTRTVLATLRKKSSAALPESATTCTDAR